MPTALSQASKILPKRTLITWEILQDNFSQILAYICFPSLKQTCQSEYKSHDNFALQILANSRQLSVVQIVGLCLVLVFCCKIITNNQISQILAKYRATNSRKFSPILGPPKIVKLDCNSQRWQRCKTFFKTSKLWSRKRGGSGVRHWLDLRELRGRKNRKASKSRPEQLSQNLPES